ncbi:MAG TPA: DUF362 domain-containing protein [Pyrinomonadaceae bacterium]|nr:DUF362 domain-containing protein [Pyrinomonadaceae bacterium]
MTLPRRAVPFLGHVRQKLPSNHITDPRIETYQRLVQSGLLERINKGDKIAITAGSRGIRASVDILTGIVEAVRHSGGDPFIIPAMGSHGGATADGQVEILKRLGITEDTVRTPIRATMNTQAVGTAATGAVAHLDEIAAQADGIIVLARIKTHPENASGVASGLLKMATVGLGKQRGAQEAHTNGLWESVKAVPKLTLAHAKILAGVAVVENGFQQPVHIEVVPPGYDQFEQTDRRLLDLAKPHVAKIPFSTIDLLVVDQLGKNISGTGMDLNVIGDWRLKGGVREPDYKRIVVLSLTPESLGNGLGIGLADFTTRRFLNDYDPHVTYVNLLTATEPGIINTREGPPPLALASDRDAIEVALFSSLAPEQPRVCRIRNTASLDELWLSAPLLKEAEQNSKLIVDGPLSPMEFDNAGNLF